MRDPQESSQDVQHFLKELAPWRPSWGPLGRFMGRLWEKTGQRLWQQKWFRLTTVSLVFALIVYYQVAGLSFCLSYFSLLPPIFLHQQPFFSTSVPFSAESWLERIATFPTIIIWLWSIWFLGRYSVVRWFLRGIGWCLAFLYRLPANLIPRLREPMLRAPAIWMIRLANWVIIWFLTQYRDIENDDEYCFDTRALCILMLTPEITKGELNIGGAARTDSDELERRLPMTTFKMSAPYVQTVSGSLQGRVALVTYLERMIDTEILPEITSEALRKRLVITRFNRAYEAALQAGCDLEVIDYDHEEDEEDDE